MSSIGMMDGAFFVGRKEIIDWINETLSLNLNKVEQTASGAIACQLLDIMYPGQVPMHKVNWAAKQNFEFVANYKILQTCFLKLQIDRMVDVDRLIKGKYQDNFEFMQWYKRFFELQVHERGDYDAAAVRVKGKGGAAFNDANGRGSSGQGSIITSASSVPKPPRVAAATKKPAASAPPKPPAAAKENQKPPSATATKAASAIQKTDSAVADTFALTEALSQIDELKNSKAEMQLEMDRLEKERDFYFDKLREIEMILQDLEDAGEGTDLTANIFKILYATADGFEVTDGEPVEETGAQDEETF